MANQLKMAVVHTVYTLLERGWSRRRIAGVKRQLPVLLSDNYFSRNTAAVALSFFVKSYRFL